LSESLGEILRQAIHQASEGIPEHPLLRFLKPLFDKQKQVSFLPKQNELLTELLRTRDGFHLFVYPFEGRLVHQALASMLAYRLSRLKPVSFSMAMNDYGFELLSDQPIDLREENVRELFSPENFYADLEKSLNAAELGKRKFRDIAVIAGLVFQGFPGAYKKQRHLQNSASLIYQVLKEHEPESLLLQQAENEAFVYEIEAERLKQTLERIARSRILISRPGNLTPFSFPIKVDSLRETLSSEKLADRIRRMQQQIN